MECRSPETVLEELKQRKHRLTAARRAIVAVVLGLGKPVSAQEVLTELRRMKVPANVTTVYRELEFLRDQGMLVAVVFADGVQRYESSDLGHHHHLICVQCHTVRDVEVPHGELEAVERQIEKTHQFDTVLHALEFYGRCSLCR